MSQIELVIYEIIKNIANKACLTMIKVFDMLSH